MGAIVLKKPVTVQDQPGSSIYYCATQPILNVLFYNTGSLVNQYFALYSTEEFFNIG